MTFANNCFTNRLPFTRAMAELMITFWQGSMYRIKLLPFALCISLAALTNTIVHADIMDLQLTPRLEFHSSSLTLNQAKAVADPFGDMICTSGTVCANGHRSILPIAECFNVNLHSPNRTSTLGPIKWACSAPVPPGITVASWTVRCASAKEENANRTYSGTPVFRDSCRLEYSLEFVSKSHIDHSSNSSPVFSDSTIGKHSSNRNKYPKHIGARLLAATLTCSILAVCFATLYRHYFAPRSLLPQPYVNPSRRFHYRALLSLDRQAVYQGYAAISAKPWILHRKFYDFLSIAKATSSNPTYSNPTDSNVVLRPKVTGNVTHSHTCVSSGPVRGFFTYNANSLQNSYNVILKIERQLLSVLHACPRPTRPPSIRESLTAIHKVVVCKVLRDDLIDLSSIFRNPLTSPCCGPKYIVLFRMKLGLRAGSQEAKSTSWRRHQLFIGRVARLRFRSHWLPKQKTNNFSVLVQNRTSTSMTSQATPCCAKH